MERIEQVIQTDFSNIPIDPFWNTGGRENKMHRIHAYPAKFPAFIATKVMEFAKKESDKEIDSVADIFCGCGTVAFESRRSGVAFWGCDINPVATLIAQAKSSSYQTRRLNRYLEEILGNFEDQPCQNAYANAPERLAYWFKKQQYNDLYRIKSAIRATIPSDNKYARFFYCAFSNILKSTSVWLTKSIKPQVDPHKIPADVRAMFVKQCRLMVSAYDESKNDLVKETQAEIVTENILNPNLKLPNVDLLITSPPYVTSYEYADLHQLSSLWLEYALDYRDLRKGAIGSKHQDFNFEREVKHLNDVGHDIVFRLINEDKAKARSVAKYFLDMQKVAQQAYQMLNASCYGFFVIGNTEYKGIRIDNAKHLCQALQNAGFNEVFVTKRKISNKILTPYRDSKGRFTTDKTGRKVYAEEFIIAGRKE